jgi:hypothetical protein
MGIPSKRYCAPTCSPRIVHSRHSPSRSEDLACPLQTVDTVARADAKHVVAITASVVNECHYRVTANSTMALRHGVAPETVTAVRAGKPLEGPKLEAVHTLHPRHGRQPRLGRCRSGCDDLRPNRLLGTGGTRRSLGGVHPRHSGVRTAHRRLGESGPYVMPSMADMSVAWSQLLAYLASPLIGGLVAAFLHDLVTRHVSARTVTTKQV